jgi:hypothetical protein
MKNRLLSIISSINRNAPKSGVSIKKIMRMFKYQSNEIILFLTLIPIALPIPLPPGISSILILPATFVVVQMLFNVKTIWLPKSILNIKINRNIVRNINNISNKYINFISKMTKNKFHFFVSRKFYFFHKILILILCLMIIIPMPLIPTVFAFSAILIVSGLIVKDGVITLVGWIISVISLAMIGILIYAIFILHSKYHNLFSKFISYFN